MSSGPAQDRGFQIVRLSGNPTTEEEDALLDALADYLAREEAGAPSQAPAAPAWTLAGRLAGRRGGVLNARPSLGASAWRLSARLPWGGLPYQGRVGRGESR